MLQSDFVESALGATETTETKVGTINIPSKGVSKIVGIVAIIHGVTTTAEENFGYVKLSFKTVAGSFRFGCQVHYAGAGTLVGPPADFTPKVIPVDIPVPQNETVDCYIAQFVAATGAERGYVQLLME